MIITWQAPRQHTIALTDNYLIIVICRTVSVCSQSLLGISCDFNWFGPLGHWDPQFVFF